MKYYIGIDIGGTNLSSGVVDESYKIIGRGKTKTGSSRPYDEILPDIIESVNLAVKDAGVAPKDNVVAESLDVLLNARDFGQLF